MNRLKILAVINYKNYQMEKIEIKYLLAKINN